MLNQFPVFEVQYYLEQYEDRGTEYTRVTAIVTVGGEVLRSFTQAQGTSLVQLESELRPFARRLEVQKFLYYQITQKVAAFQRDYMINPNKAMD